MSLKICCISDTHNKHNQITIPPCDILIHAGDATSVGLESEVRRFAKWFHEQPARYKIFVPGNHEDGFENALPLSKTWFQEECPDGILLIHEPIWIEGINIFGSPYTPFFHNWAFNVLESKRLRQLWEQIPKNTNILITHGPPYGIGDYTIHGQKRAGCLEMPDIINKLPDLKLHVFGHIHEGYGKYEDEGRHISVNASICTLQYQATNSPIEVDYA
jgi:Icc-related predicted phosphoesterase